MKTIAAVFADFVEGPLGAPAVLNEPLAGRRVIDHTLQRLARIGNADQRYLVVGRRDADQAENAVKSACVRDRVRVMIIDDAPYPRAPLIRAARRWGPAAWRGTPLSTTWFDEYINAFAVAQVLDRTGAEAALCVEAHQAALDPALSAAMIHHQQEQLADAKMVFTAAPPGLCGVVLRREAVRDLLEGDFPLGMLLTYRPEIPQPDPLTKPVCLPIDPRIARTSARLMADTQGGREILSAALTARGAEADAAAICDWFAEAVAPRPERLPIEVEVEITTDDPLPDTKLRPRGSRVPTRRLADLGALKRLARELATYDDRRVVLGGFGDPLLHPEFSAICRVLRDCGVSAIGVVTPLVEMRDEVVEAMFSTPVDLIQVRLDAHSANTYNRVNGRDCYDRVIANIHTLEQMRQTRAAPRPFLLCSMTRCAATIAEMEAFYDHWMRVLGGALLEGYDSFGDALPTDDLIATIPPVREACRRLNRRMVLFADGSTPQCSQDFAGSTKLGDWRRDSLASIWLGKPLSGLRVLHAAGDWSARPLCAACEAWHRP
ncbi:MAG: radical SAM protein [Phycisphaerales bacterium]|nr:radical SAM protein [Phycisphaerales bacterium]